MRDSSKDAKNALLRYIKETGISQAEAARRLSVSKATVSLFLKGSYRGNNGKLTHRIKHRINPLLRRSICGFFFLTGRFASAILKTVKTSRNNALKTNYRSMQESCEAARPARHLDVPHISPAQNGYSLRLARGSEVSCENIK